MRCYSCGGRLRTIIHGGCGGSGEVAGCVDCDAVFRFEGGGICTSAHPVIEYHKSFKEESYLEAKNIKPRLMKDDWYKERYPDKYGKWSWGELGHGDYHDCETEEEAKAQIAAYVKTLFDKLDWPVCDKCGKKPEDKYGFGRCFRCEGCRRVTYGTTWHDER